MFRTSTLAFIIACLLTGAAFADTSVKVGIKGYNDFFDRCDLAVETQTTAKEATLYYRILAGAKGGAICEQAPYSSGCRSTDDFEYTCEDISRIDVLHVKCEGEDGGLASCGKVSVGKGDGMKAPLEVQKIKVQTDGLKLFASLLGGPNYSGGCAMGITYSARPGIDIVKMTYEVPVAGQTDECSLSMGGTMSTGLSCLGADNYSCDAVKKVNITSITCETDGSETDCGTVSIDALEKDVFVDAR
ncbi:MAG: hypothetical protein AAGH68_00315 [Pseudomonadota bacterium]